VRRVPLIETILRFVKGGSGRPLIYCAWLLVAAGCASANAKTVPLPHDGSSLEQAIPILESTEAAGVAAERAWIAEHYPGARKLLGGLRADQGRHYDVVKLRLPDGAEKTLYFDITAYFGF